MMTLGVDLADREARLIGIWKGENGPDAVRTKRPAISHAGLVTFTSGLTALEGVGTGAPSGAANPFAAALKHQLVRWGTQPSSIVFTGPDLLFEDEALRAWLFDCGRALNPDRDPILTTTRQAILTALAYQPVPLIAVILQPLRGLDLPEEGQPVRRGARDHSTNVVGLTESGQSHFAPPLNPRVDDLASDIWTPDTPGPALQQWLSDVVQRVNDLTAKMGPGPIPVYVVGNPVTYPHMVTLLSAKLPKVQIQWAQPWELFATQEVHRPLLNTLGTALMPALGAALTTHQSSPTDLGSDDKAAAVPQGSFGVRNAEFGVQNESLQDTLDRPARPGAIWGYIALATLLAWIPVLGELSRRETVAKRRVTTAQAAIQESKAQIARLEELQAFVNRSQPKPIGAPLTDILRAALANVPASVYITGCRLEARPDGPHLTLQGLTRQPNEVKKWVAGIERSTRAKAEPPTFNHIKPRYQFGVSFSGFQSAIPKVVP